MDRRTPSILLSGTTALTPQFWSLDRGFARRLPILDPADYDCSGLRYLVRDASADGNTLHLTGDLNRTTTTLLVLAESHISALTWNGKELSTRRNRWGALQSNLPDIPEEGATLHLPALKGWRYIDSLPELADSFDDSNWTKADKTSTGE